MFRKIHSQGEDGLIEQPEKRKRRIIAHLVCETILYRKYASL